jgi:hypothetical protein
VIWFGVKAFGTGIVEWDGIIAFILVIGNREVGTLNLVKDDEIGILIIGFQAKVFCA